MAFYVFDVVEFGRQGIVDVDDDNLPVGFAFVEERHHAEHFDLLDLAGVCDGFADFADVERVVVASGFGVWVCAVGVFPGLVERKFVCRKECALSCRVDGRCRGMTRRWCVDGLWTSIA